ncbi:MAG: ATP-binding protein, partial [Bryobacteraceae bacterium]
IKDGLPNYRFERLAQTSDGSLWVGFRGGSGIARITFEGSRLFIQTVRPRPGLMPALAIALETDVFGRLWHTTDDGVDFLDGTKWRHYGSADGLVWDDCNGNAFWGDDDGSVWIGTSQGLSHFRLPKLALTHLPPAIITSYSLGGSLQKLQGTPSVPYSDGTFTAAFTALTYVNDASVRFRYRLRGLEESWTEARVREVRYPSLPAGDYTFEVMARNSEGNWNVSAANVSFSILPAWWQALPFRISCFIALLSMASVLWMWRFGNIIKTQRKLEAAVQQRTAELLRAQAKVIEEKKNVEGQKLEIERLLHESQRATQFKSQFLANMSHEIRTPMNGIIGMTDLTLDSPLDPEQRNNLQLVRSSATSLLSVINDILDFSKVEAGKLDLEYIEFDLAGHLNDVLGMLAYRSREKGLVLNCKIESGVPAFICGDPGRLRQILVNLLGNAIKFTDAGEVLLRVNEPPFADEAPAADTISLHFSVKDQGIGIPRDQQALILEPFRQADESVTRKYGGTGLGLAICTQLVALMNGKMWLESEVGKGSTFHFTAEFKRAAATKLAAGREFRNDPFAAISRPLRILVAEDNAVNQRLISALLMKKGHAVTVVASGTEAVGISARQPFDLILMDMQMPEMDGFEATMMIREREKATGSRLRIVAVTAGAMAGDRERCLAAGLDDYLAKPIDAAALYRIVNLVPPPSGTPPVLASAGAVEGATTPGGA